MSNVFDAVEEHRRADALAAIGSVADPTTVTEVTPRIGGASGAKTLRVAIGSHAYLLRLDVARPGLQDPNRTYPCLRVAADAGIAPAVHYAYDAAGVVLMDYVSERPLTTYPGGAIGVVRALGAIVAQLQTLTTFPVLTETFGELVEVLLNLTRGGRLFASGVLDDHVSGLARLRAEYPWDTAQVSAHNDINPRNVLFDGQRLWLVDWELAFGNDPFADLANVANNFAEVPAVDTLVLEGWLDGSPDEESRHRLAMMRDLHRLFYGCLLLSEFFGRRDPEAQLTAPTPTEFSAAIDRGELQGTRELLFVLGKMNLVAFSDSQRS